MTLNCTDCDCRDIQGIGTSGMSTVYLPGDAPRPVLERGLADRETTDRALARIQNRSTVSFSSSI